MKKLFILPILLTVCLVFTGCPKKSTQSVMTTSAQVMDQFSSLLLQAQNITSQLHIAGVMDDATFASAQSTFKTIATTGISVDALIKSGDQANAKIALNSMALTLQVLIEDGKTGIKDPTSKQEWAVAVGGILTIVQSVEASL